MHSDFSFVKPSEWESENCNKFIFVLNESGRFYVEIVCVQNNGLNVKL
jgi:hypothetical protein